jgi:hypothetical protein
MRRLADPAGKVTKICPPWVVRSHMVLVFVCEQVLIVKGKDMLIVGCGMSGITSILAMTASGSTTMRISQL